MILRSVVTTVLSLIFLLGIPLTSSGSSYQFERLWPQLPQPWYFAGPSVATDSAGNFYVATSSTNRIQKFDGTGALLASWGSPGTGPGQFNSPTAVAVDTTGNVYVVDAGNGRIQQFNVNGSYLTSWVGGGAGFNAPQGVTVDAAGDVYVADTQNNQIQKFTSNGTFITAWGTKGSANGQFNMPRGVAIDGSGHVLVADSNNYRVQTFDSSGTWISTWAVPGLASPHTLAGAPYALAIDTGSGNIFVADALNSCIQIFDGNGAFLALIGRLTLVKPGGVALDSGGNIYVADTGSQRIKKYSSTGIVLNNWGSASLAPSSAYPEYGLFNTPVGVTADASGEIWVADSLNFRVQKFTNTGAFLTKYGAAIQNVLPLPGQFDMPVGVAQDSVGNFFVVDRTYNRIQKFDSSGNYLLMWGNYGPGQGQFNQPQGIAVDSANDVYVSDTANNRIQKFANDGTWLAAWGGTGAGDGQFSGPTGISIDASGNLFVSDKNNNRIQAFTTTGTWLASMGTAGSGDGQLNHPTAVASDAAGNIYVADTGNHRIQIFSANGTPLAIVGSNGLGPGEFLSPQGITVDSAGAFYVSDTGNNRIQKFTPMGTGAITVDSPTVTFDGTPKTVLVTTTPSGLAYSVTYNGSATPPANAGTYQVVATITDPAYSGSAAGTLTITPAAANISVTSPSLVYDGMGKSVTLSTVPPNLTTTVSYNGSNTLPVNVGTYTVTAVIADPNYSGSTTGVLTITPATATVNFSSLTAVYDGSPKGATAATNPPGLATTLSYTSGGTPIAAPIQVGSYGVSATVVDPNYAGSASGTFSLTAPQPVRLASAPSTFYPLVAPCYALAIDGDTIQLLDGAITEPVLNFANPVTITLAGGFDPTITAQTGITILNGIVTVSAGTVVVDRIAIQ